MSQHTPIHPEARIGHVHLRVADLERAIAFYRDVLGLAESEFTEGEIEAPNVTLSFWEPERDGLAFTPNEAGVGLRVADVGAARAELEARGVEFIGDTYDSSVCHMGFFKDPDGNVVILHRRYAARTPR
jgi:catechol 2,3-dioxygenase-like lactoylglutathione lyase family enzyme